MAEKKEGKKNRKIGRNKAKCTYYAAVHMKKVGEHRITGSKEHRACGPLGLYNRTVLKASNDEAVHWTNRSYHFDFTLPMLKNKRIKQENTNRHEQALRIAWNREHPLDWDF